MKRIFCFIKRKKNISLWINFFNDLVYLKRHIHNTLESRYFLQRNLHPMSTEHWNLASPPPPKMMSARRSDIESPLPTVATILMSN